MFVLRKGILESSLDLAIEKEGGFSPDKSKPFHRPYRC